MKTIPGSTPTPRPGTLGAWILRVAWLPMAVVLGIGALVSLQRASGSAETWDSVRLRGPWFFHLPLEPIGVDKATAREAELILAAVKASTGAHPLEAADLLDQFVEEHPDSVWAPSIRANLGYFFKEELAYSRALAAWEWVWERTKLIESGPGKSVADYTLAHWTRLLASMGRVEELEVLFEETQGRVLDEGPLQQRYLRSRDHWSALKKTPAISYRCGWQVLSQLSEAVEGRSFHKVDIRGFYGDGRLFAACSMKSLRELAAIEGLTFEPVERPAGSAEVPLNSVAHLNQGHYIAVLEEQNGLLKVYDPIWGIRHMEFTVLEQEASGLFMTLGETPKGWRRLSEEESANVLGRCGGDPGTWGGWPDNWDCPPWGCPKPPGQNPGGNAGNPS